jgi:hypothetical protein
MRKKSQFCPGRMGFGGFAEAGLGICNGNRIDDWHGCAQHDFRGLWQSSGVHGSLGMSADFAASGLDGRLVPLTDLTCFLSPGPSHGLAGLFF